jgi:hypothetical protein
MSEDASESVNQEILEEEVASPPVLTENSERPADSEAERRRRNDVEYNWAEARRKRDELERRITEQQELITSLKQQKESSQDSEMDSLQDDDILTVAQAKKMLMQQAKKAAQEVVREREASTLEDRISLKFPDYLQVVSQENIEFLKQTEPELALSLYHIPDPYQQAVAAYKMLKRLGNGPPTSSPEKRKATENAQKPVSVNAATRQSAIGNAHHFENGLTPELKSQLYKEMVEAMKKG